MATTTTQPPLLLTPRQAAQTLAISPRKLWDLTNSGDVPHIRIGRSVRYPAAALERWVAGGCHSHKEGGGDDAKE